MAHTDDHHQDDMDRETAAHRRAERVIRALGVLAYVNGLHTLDIDYVIQSFELMGRGQLPLPGMTPDDDPEH